MNYAYFLIILILALSSCRDTNPALDEAAQLAVSNPKKALEVLEGISPDRLSDDERLSYGISLSMARCAFKIPLSDSALVQFCYDYPESRLFKHSEDIARGAYYRALYAFQNEDIEGAVKYALIAKESAEENDLQLWMGRVCTLLGDIAEFTYNFEESISLSEEAAEAFAAIDSMHHYQYAVLGIAHHYCNIGDTDKCHKLLDSVFSRQNYYNKNVEDVANDIYSVLYWRENEPLTAYNYLNQITDTIIKQSLGSRNIEASVYINLGWLERADSVVSLVMAEGNEEELTHPDFLRVRAGLASARGDYRNAYLFEEQMGSNLYEIISEMMANSAVKFQSKFYNELSAQRKRDYIFRRNIFVAALVLLLAVTVLGGLAGRRAYLRRRRELTAKEEQLAELRHDADMLVADMRRTRQQAETASREAQSYRNTYEAMTDTLNFILTQTGRIADTSSQSVRQKRITDIVERIGSQEFMKPVEDYINSRTDGLIADTRAAFPDGTIKESDYSMLLLLALGMSTQGVMAALDLNQSTFYTRRKRLRERIAASSFERRDQLLAYL